MIVPDPPKGHDESDLEAEPDFVAGLFVLQVGHDAIGALDVAADQVFEEVVVWNPPRPCSS